MRKISVAIVACFMVLFVFAGCAQSQRPGYQDGSYRAEFRDFDSYGYKDYLEVTVQDGVVTAIEYNGVNEEGGLKTDDEKYASDMQAAVQETYPAKYTADLENQYMEKQDIDLVDALAGATYSSESFKTLFLALETNMAAGNGDTVLVDNISPQK